MATGIHKHKPHQGFQKGHKLFMNPDSLRGRRLSPATEFKPGLVPWNKGKTGVMPVPWNKGIKSHVKPWLGKTRPDMRGSKNPMWVPNPVTDESSLARHRIPYKEWRKHVFNRDDFTCQACGQRGGVLNADHELPFSQYPDLRYEILNGRTLCVPCHKKTNTYGGKIRNTYNMAQPQHYLLPCE